MLLTHTMCNCIASRRQDPFRKGLMEHGYSRTYSVFAISIGLGYSLVHVVWFMSICNVMLQPCHVVKQKTGVLRDSRLSCHASDLSQKNLPMHRYMWHLHYILNGYKPRCTGRKSQQRRIRAFDSQSRTLAQKNNKAKHIATWGQSQPKILPHIQGSCLVLNVNPSTPFKSNMVQCGLQPVRGLSGTSNCFI